VIQRLKELLKCLISGLRRELQWKHLLKSDGSHHHRLHHHHSPSPFTIAITVAITIPVVARSFGHYVAIPSLLT
jgi:hypothetical protein